MKNYPPAAPSRSFSCASPIAAVLVSLAVGCGATSTAPVESVVSFLTEETFVMPKAALVVQDKPENGLDSSRLNEAALKAALDTNCPLEFVSHQTNTSTQAQMEVCGVTKVYRDDLGEFVDASPAPSQTSSSPAEEKPAGPTEPAPKGESN